MTSKVVKDVCQQDLGLDDDIDVGLDRGVQEERCRLTEEVEKWGDEAIEDEVDLRVELV